MDETNLFNKGFFKNILDRLPIPASVKEVQTLKYVYCNDAFANLFGKTKEQIFNKTTPEIFDKNISKTIVSADEWVCNSGQPKTELIYLAKNLTQVVAYELINEPYFNDITNSLQFIISIFQPLRKAISADEILRETEILYKKIFESLPVGVLIFRDNDFTIIDVNSHFLCTFGVELDQILYNSFFNLPFCTQQEKFKSLLQIAKETNTEQQFEFSYQLPNGRKLETLTIVSYIHFLTLDPLYFLIISDISSLQEINREIISFVQKEQELLSLKNRFISIVNHELISPLTAITLAVDLLQRFGDKLPIVEKEKQFEVIRDSVQTIKKLIENAMHLEQLTSDTFLITPRKIYIKNFLEDIINKLQALFENKNPITINIASDFEIEIDEILLNLIFNNLISNAFKYSPPGTPITINVEHQDNWLIASVNNLGEVISPEDITKIFNPFFRGKNACKIKGFGLGLSLVKKAVEILKGTIEVESYPDAGTTFLLRLPTNLTS